ncbi:MAG: hypothetical protein WBB08_09420 [Halobacteriota archaeon]
MTAHLLTAAHGTEMAPTGRPSAAVAGAASPGTADLLIATTTTPAIATTTSAFVFFRSCNYVLRYHLLVAALRVSYMIAYFNFSSITMSTLSKLSSLDSTIFGVCL